MAKKLLIVESPAKAKTINKYLGNDFIVKSSYGHIRDLDKGNKGIDKENGFEPKYVISPEKKKVVKELKTALKSVNEVWLATDEDREGEAISWHLCQVLGLDEDTTKRIVFREITKSAIQKAIEEPRLVDKYLVDAQQARRILDRLVGFELSEILWRKVKGKLSAGRVQSVAVKLIVDREREINAHDARAFYKVMAIFDVKNNQGNNVELKAELKERYATYEEAEKFLNNHIGADYKITDIKVKPTKRRPAPPFTTSTLQQDASRKLYFSVNRTMSTAQKLYEQGFITYMRTDSMSLSETAIAAIEQEIKSEFGDRYSKPRRFSTKDSNAQEAHEAIRPSYIQNTAIQGDRDMQRLYELIWKRTIASQMAEAELEKTTVDITSSANAVFEAKGEVLKFDGFLKVYMESKDEEEDEDAKGILPPLKIDQQLDLNQIEAVERFTRPPARYTEASLVKKLEELGIGRPSTYAPTISKIMEKERGYVTKESREGVERKYNVLTLKNGGVSSQINTEMTGATSNRLYPSDLGILVSDFLSEHFKDIMTYSFTADIEDKLDQIASGQEEWQEMIEDFYGPFHDTVEKTINEAQRVKGRRDLGKDPESGHTVLAQMTRFGPVVQIGTREEVGEEGKPKFANLKPGQSIETIEYEEAMELFKLPVTVGDYEGKEVIVNAGRFGPYVKFDDKFISLSKGEDPMSVSLERAIELIEAKRKEDAPIGTYKGQDITKGKGRFGPFLKWNEMFINIPKRMDPDNLSVEEINGLIEAKIEKEANRYIRQWTDEKIALENGRWGPFIRFKKKSFKLPKKEDGEKFTSEELKDVELDQVKKWLKEGGAKGIK
ncbi:MAG: type I DNA topoisomerase [Saprospiraceae bacterium]|nr:type I DNA topoisomerase [Saprospiraceae bacterium]